jgi:dihydrofolate synthase / folylpolyglutamate synthase
VDLRAALDYLDRHVNLEATAGRVHGLSLDRMRDLASVLGDPQHAYPVIHLTGTNGKGSTARMATALLAEAGLSVGTYTSPHLERVNERITRNGEPIDDDALAAVLGDLARVEAEGLVDVAPSYFELLTAAAFRWFAEVAIDVAVVEVGLLGRFDATNVVDAKVAVVTNVGHDHSDFVGDWRHAVASEKAGIIKPGSVAIVGETDPDLVAVFEAEASSPDVVVLRERDFSCEENTLAVGGRLLDLRTPSGTLDDVFLSLHGAHQGDNAVCAVTAVEAFFARPLSREVVTGALGSVTVPGRFEVVGRSPLVVLDGAHNPEGAASAAATLADDFAVDGGTILVVGVLAPRDPADVLGPLGAADARLVVACAPPSPRAVPADDVAAAARALGARDVVAVPDVAAAVDHALATAGPDDAVLVTGSLYVIAPARGVLR